MMAIAAFDEMKRLVKKIILWINGIFRSDWSGKVIYYHDVGICYTRMGTPVDMFKEHIRVAKENGFRFVSTLDDLAGENTLLICFDDGFHGIYDQKDFFVAEGLHPVIFIAVDLVGRDGYLSWDEIGELQKLGFIFESHTWTHQTLSGTYIDESPAAVRTDEWYAKELVGSRVELEKRLKCDVRAICFPAGHFSAEVLSRCVKAGYSVVYTSIPGSHSYPIRLVQVSEPIRIVPRVLCQSYDQYEFLMALRGALNVFQSRFMDQHMVLCCRKRYIPRKKI